MLLYPLCRHRRPLLFPPGLLALGFLLLLGCLAVRPWYRQLKSKYVMQLTLPPKPVSDYIYPTLFIDSKEVKKLAKDGFKINPNRNDHIRKYSELAHFRPWQDFAFTGVPEHDAATAQQAQQAFGAMHADKLHAGGIRIHFGEQATYASLVRMLDLANATKKQLLDFHHTPATFYAFTDVYNPMLVDLSNDVLYPKPPPASSKIQMLTWQEAFSSPAWRNSIYLLLGIVAVNSWKMARRWHTA